MHLRTVTEFKRMLHKPNDYFTDIKIKHIDVRKNVSQICVLSWRRLNSSKVSFNSYMIGHYK